MTRCVPGLDYTCIQAVKTLHGSKGGALDNNQISKFCAEAKLMATLQSRNGGISHPNLVQMKRCCFEGNELMLVLQFHELGTLEDVLQNANDLNIVDRLIWVPDGDGVLYNLTIGIAKGLEYLHSVNVIHRDVKPTNVLIEGEPSRCVNWNARISDFGESRASACIVLTQRATLASYYPASH